MMGTYNVTFNQNKTYKMNPAIEDTTERYTFSHYNECGSAFFHTIGNESEIDQIFWLSKSEIEENILIAVTEDNMTTLTKENAKENMMIIQKQHPEHGTFRLRKDKYGDWEVTNGRGVKMLAECEFHFWRLLV